MCDHQDQAARVGPTTDGAAREIEFCDGGAEWFSQMAEWWQSGLRKRFHEDDGFSIVAHRGKELAGYISVCLGDLPAPLAGAGEAFIDFIEVRADCRRRGVGRRLVELAAEQARAAGAVQLRAWSNRTKLEAIPMWAALGFGLCPADPRDEGMPGYYVARRLDGGPDGAPAPKRDPRDEPNVWAGPFPIRRMSREEVDRIGELDVTEEGTVIHKWVDGRVQVVPHVWRQPSRSAEAWAERAAMVRAALDSGGLAVGAFDGEKLVGFAAGRFRLAPGMAQLDALWVSRAYRRRGIAAALVCEVLRAMKDAGAWAVYVTASPAEASQAFYGRLGFRAAVFVHRDLYDQEPDDIHMIKVLRPPAAPSADWMCVGEGG